MDSISTYYGFLSDKIQLSACCWKIPLEYLDLFKCGKWVLEMDFLEDA